MESVCELAPTQSRFPEVRELRPSRYFETFPSGQRVVDKGKAKVTSTEPDTTNKATDLTITKIEEVDDTDEVTATHVDGPENLDETQDDGLSKRGLMIRNSGRNMNIMSEASPPGPDEAIASMNHRVADLETRRAEVPLEARFERELSLEENPQVADDSDTHPALRESGIINRRRIVAPAAMYVKARTGPSNMEKIPLDMWSRMMNRPPIIGEPNAAAQSHAASRIHDLRSPLDELQYNARQVSDTSSSFGRPYPPAIPMRSPARLFVPQTTGASPNLTRQMESSAFYPLIPNDSTPIPPKKEWNERPSRQ